MRTVSICLVLLATSIAHADSRTTTLARTCAEVSPNGLDETYRARAEELLSRALEQANLFVVDRDCMETYRIEFANQNRQLVLDGPGARVSRDLGETGDLATEVTMLLELQRRMRDKDEAAPRDEVAPREETEPARPAVATSYPVTSNEAVDNESPPEVSKALPVKTLYYFRYGVGTVASADPGGAASFGIRRTLGKADLDVSANFVADTAYGLKLLLLSTPAPNRAALFAGGGLSASVVETPDVSEAGIGAELSAGVSLTPSHKWFVQMDLSLPFYSTPDGYPAMFVMSIGYGLARH